MKSVTNLLQWIYDNWASIATILVLLFGIYKKVLKTIDDWKNKSEEEKKQAKEEATQKAISIARNSLSDYILNLVAKAETDWNITSGLGEIKRAQVIEEIYDKYPILEQVTDKEELLGYIDTLITDSLKTVREKLRDSVIEESKG